MYTLDNARTDIQGYAKKKILYYYEKITKTASSTPAAARAFEHTALMRYYLDVRNEAQQKFTEAFKSFGVEYPDLLWTKEVNPKLNDNPPFKYCDVLASFPQDDMDESDKDVIVPDQDANPDKFSYVAPIGLGVSGAVFKGISALIGNGAETSALAAETSALAAETSALASVLSVTGTVLIISGVALGAYTVFRNGRQVSVSQVVGKEDYEGPEEVPSSTGLGKLMGQQKDYNLKVMLSWLNDAYRLAKEAEQHDSAQRGKG